MKNKYCPYCRKEIKERGWASHERSKAHLKKKELIDKFKGWELENKKKVFDTYCEALIEYNVSNMAFSSIHADKIWRKELVYKNIGDFLFRKQTSDRELKVVSDIKYYDNLIKIAEKKIEKLPYPIKKKIVKDAITRWKLVEDVWEFQSKKSKEKK